MNKSDYAAILFEEIKDEIQLDSDVKALESLLLILLDEDLQKSVNNWQYLINKYDLQSITLDIDFMPIVKNYPIALLKRVGIESFFYYMSKFPTNEAKIIYSNIFNIFDKDCYIYQILNLYIDNNDYQNEKKLIDLLLQKSKYFFEGTFDKTEFIRRIILLHINRHKISKAFFQELINTLDSKKDKAVLKTELIDYMIIKL